MQNEQNIITNKKQRGGVDKNLTKKCTNSDNINVHGGIKVYPAVDIVKFLFCLCVIAIHTNALANFPTSIAYMAEKAVFRLAVPYFFCASGFFWGRKFYSDVPKANTLKTFVLRLLKPLLVFESLRIIINIISDIILNEQIDWIYILQRILFQPDGSLWYIQATIVAILWMYPILKRKMFKSAIICTVLLYISGLLCNSYYFVICNTPIQSIVETYMSFFMTARNGIFLAPIFLLSGVLISQRKIPSVKKCLLFIIPLFVILAGEVVLIHTIGFSMDDRAYYLMQPLLVPLLFCLTLQFPHIKNINVAVKLRNYSSGMYFLHDSLIIPILTLLGLVKGMSLFLLTSVLCFLICTIFYKSKKEPIYSLLK